MKKSVTIFSAILAIVLISHTMPSGNLDIKLNDIQIIGSHNSYKIGIEKPLLDYLMKTRPTLSGLEYEHIPLSEQLDLGLRSLELDVYYDPKGGHYTDPRGLDIIKSLGAIPEPFDVENKLMEPGLKVFHVQDIDFRSHQLLFRDALIDLKKWSNDHKGHTPIIITINAKDDEIPQMRKPLPFSAEALRSIDIEIRGILGEDHLITPDRVRGKFETLEEAVLAQGWPLLDEVKNRFLFVLDEGTAKTDAYLTSYPGLKNAVLFVNKEEGDPNAAFRIINDPIKDFDKIQQLVSLGYMVRTRADADTKEARENDHRKFHMAKASGAQVISTDYYIPSTFFKSDYKIVFEDGGYERLRP
ncbi:phosphatidylinositol-specific phospholipase C1-like protein [Anditalea andensis]|uniref:Phosphoinositide phospholipase C, Ca2+-dependent n=1 Tax=Anditalea andensis TaxID=1048983 RepID=A0A074L5X5_9BACT|nr:phosphatidylinositol-specific phospholipase C1-like protein [Anditalea andensis]KEO75905.1 hypothetical protein EL17_23105 [Anditalea andensis]